MVVATERVTMPQASATPSLVAMPTIAPTARAAPTATPQSQISTQSVQSPVPTFTQLTTGGCCVQPFFSPDGSQVLYLDKPRPDAPTGLYAVPVTQALAVPVLFTRRLGPFSADMAFNEFLANGQTIVERAADGKQWTIDNGGRRVLFSPDEMNIAWTVGEQSGNFDVRRSDLWLASVDGSNPRQVITLYGGGIQGWLDDSAHLLVSGKARRDDITSTLSVLSLAVGSLRKLIDVERLRGIGLSPDGRRIFYSVSQAHDASQDGSYILDISQAGATPLKLDFFGAARWCSPERLYAIPIKMGAPSNELWRIDATTGQQTLVIAAAADSAFKIGNGDWDVSRDSRRIAYFNARDHNIWVVSLPDAC